MKTLKYLILLCICLMASALYAQSPQAIEADLLHAFKKIDYWNKQRLAGQATTGDSLIEANDLFGKKLKTYTEKYPATINAPFGSLKKEHLDFFPLIANHLYPFGCC